MKYFLIILVCIETTICNSLYKEPILTEEQKIYLDSLEIFCKEEPQNFRRIARTGYTFMNFTLAGHFSLLEKAEYYLERAFSLKQDNKNLNRTLGRFYNLRVVDLDFSKTAMQEKVYYALLGDRSPDELDGSEFVSWTFYQTARAIQLQKRKKYIQALRTIRNMERAIEKRIKKRPNNVEYRALGGNYALFFAGHLPFRKGIRVRQGIEYFEYVKDNWDKMRSGAGNTFHCPNTYENFMFELGDAYLCNKEKEKAIAVFEELSQIKGVVTRSKEIIAYMSKERIQNSQWYLGKKELMPPWPSDRGNCVVCHSYNADIPMKSLFSKDSIDISIIPTNAIPKPTRLLNGNN